MLCLCRPDRGEEDETFYFIVIISKSFLKQYFRENVEVEGTVYNPYDHAVEPESIHLVEEAGRRLIYKLGCFIDEDGNEATFQEDILQMDNEKYPSKIMKFVVN